MQLDQIICGDNVEVMRTFPDASIDSIVTDPPYALSKEPKIAEVLTAWLAGEDYDGFKAGFMGADWDVIPQPKVWREAYRVLKPGGYLLSFSSTRTFDLTAIGLRLAGFEQHPVLMWAFGTGFPKAAKIGKAIDKAAGAEREVVGTRQKRGAFGGVAYAQDAWTLAQANKPLDLETTAPATDAAKQWDGWAYGKQSLKPAFEPILMFQKPVKGRMVDNVLEYGTGCINIDGCRVGHEGESLQGGGSTVGINAYVRHAAWQRPWMRDDESRENMRQRAAESQDNSEALGRWPANIIHDGSDEVLELFPDEHGKSASRFFYVAKPGPSERGSSDHPTMKPIALMRYLVRLVTPMGAVTLDPYSGSGTTCVAAREEHCRFIGIDGMEKYCDIARKRLRQKLLPL